MKGSITDFSRFFSLWVLEEEEEEEERDGFWRFGTMKFKAIINFFLSFFLLLLLLLLLLFENLYENFLSNKKTLTF